MSWKAGFCRHPRTTQERRANGNRDFIRFDDFKIKSRAKRNRKNLPNSYDDIWHQSQKSWKKLRKTQYKVG